MDSYHRLSATGDQITRPRSSHRHQLALPIAGSHGALDQIDAAALGRSSDQFIRYRALMHRLVALAEAVEPAQALDEPFSATDVVAQLPGGGLDGAIARMRFSGLAQVVQTHFHEAKSFVVGGDRGGIIT